MNNNYNYKILEVRDYFPSKNNPSSSTWVFNQVLSLKEMGYNPLVISPTPINPIKKIFKKKFRLYDTPSIKIENYEGTNVIRPPYYKMPKNKFITFTLNNLTNCITKYGNYNDIKLIHAHFGQNGYASIKLKRLLNIPLITSFYGYDSGRLGKLYKPFYNQLIKYGDVFLVLSKDMKNDLLELGFPDEKIKIHHLGINLNEFNKIDTKNNKFTILTVARLETGKGVHFIIEAVAKFVNKYPETRNKIEYRIIGGGPIESKLKQLVKKLNIEDIVVFINNLILSNSREIVRSEIQNCDIFCLSSYLNENGDKEGTPVVLMEAQACGKPCVSTFHAGIPEVVENNITGFLVEEKSIYGISESIEKLYFSDKLKEEFGSNAVIKIEQEFNNVHQMKNLNDIFCDLLKKY